MKNAVIHNQFSATIITGLPCLTMALHRQFAKKANSPSSGIIKGGYTSTETNILSAEISNKLCLLWMR